MRIRDLTRHPLTLLLGSIVALAGCPDPQGEFDAFGERLEQSMGEGGAGGEGTGGAAACTLPAAAEADGTYLFSLAAKLNPQKAIVLDTTMTTEAGADGGLVVNLSMQPLSGMDQATPVGEPIVRNDLAVAADGTFDWDFGQVTVAGAANPLTFSDIEATLQAQGTLCTQSPDFICGTITGIVTKPLNMFDLSNGSTFTMQKYEGSPPSPVINCAKEPAVY